MESNRRYVYQLSLSDGSILINESEGLWSVKDMEKKDEKVLINSAVLVKIIDFKDDVSAEALAQAEDVAEQMVAEVNEGQSEPILVEQEPVQADV